MVVPPAPDYLFPSSSAQLVHAHGRGRRPYHDSTINRYNGLPTPPRTPSPPAFVWTGERSRSRKRKSTPPRKPSPPAFVWAGESSNSRKRKRQSETDSESEALRPATQPARHTSYPIKSALKQTTRPFSKSDPNLYRPGMKFPSSEGPPIMPYENDNLNVSAPSPDLLDPFAFPHISQPPFGHGQQLYGRGPAVVNPPTPFQVQYPSVRTHPPNKMPEPEQYGPALDLSTSIHPRPSAASKYFIRSLATSMASPSSHSSRNSAFGPESVRNMERHLTQALLEAANCKETVSTWYKRAYGRWKKGNAMTPSERVIFQQVSSLHSEAKHLKAQIWRISHLLTTIPEISSSLLHPTSNSNSRRTSHQSRNPSQNLQGYERAHEYELEWKDMMTRSTCERLKVECELAIAKTLQVTSLFASLKSDLKSDSFNMSSHSQSQQSRTKNTPRRLWKYAFELPNIAAAFHLRSRKFAYRNASDEEAEREKERMEAAAAGYGKSVAHSQVGPPLTIEILKGEVDRSGRVVEFAVRGIVNAVEGCKDVLGRTYPPSPPNS